MITKDYILAQENNLKSTAIVACIKAFPRRFEGHYTLESNIYYLDDEACEMILQIIKDRELRFFSYELQKEEEKLIKEHSDLFDEQLKVFDEYHRIVNEIITAEHTLRKLEQKKVDIEKKLENIKKIQDVDFPQKIKNFQEEAYQKHVFLKPTNNDDILKDIGFNE